MAKTKSKGQTVREEPAEAEIAAEEEPVEQDQPAEDLPTGERSHPPE